VWKITGAMIGCVSCMDICGEAFVAGASCIGSNSSACVGGDVYFDACVGENGFRWFDAPPPIAALPMAIRAGS
jgi:hypothetical protein